MSGEGWQLVVFTRDDRRPFELPPPYRWLPGELHIRNGQTHATQIANVEDRDAAERLAEVAKGLGFHGVTRPRFKITNAPQELASHGITPQRRQIDLGLKWLADSDPHYKRRRRRARARKRP